ncbi:MAG: DUF4878 domain-containing protein [Ferruginibacter sp.]|nr:DUF4878 domain-containing protein [Ferruginibacter sp.]
MKNLLLAVTVLCSVAFVSCKSNSGGNPNEVLSQFFDAMAKQDSVKIKALTTKDSESMLNMMTMGMSMADSKKDLEKYDKTKMEFGAAIINGDNAKVPVKDKASGETVNFPMKKEDGKWKVAFDKTSVMGMGMEQMKEGKMNVGDSIEKGMDAMKDVNMDSMMNEVKKAMDTSKMDMNK